MSANRFLPVFRDAVNVDDELQRDKLIRRLEKLRAFVMESKAIAEAWNAAHPTDVPLSTRFEDAMIAYLYRRGPWSAVNEAYLESRGVKTLGSAS